MELDSKGILVNSKYGSGDGTVNLRSLEGCKSWPNVSVKKFLNVNHVGLLKNPKTFNYLKKIL